MLKPDPQAARELQGLRHGAVHKYVEAAYAETRDMLVTQLNVDVLRALQGRAQALRELLGLIDESFSTNGKRG